MRPVLNITQDQKAKIHIAKSAAGLSDSNYRAILSGFNNKDGVPCSSCSEFTYNQAEVLLNIFKDKLGFKEKRKYKDSKYAQYAGRESKFASVAQLELIDYKWFSNLNVKEKTDEAMNHFIKRIAGTDHISFLLKKDVSKVIKAISSLMTRSGDEV